MRTNKVLLICMLISFFNLEGRAQNGIQLNSEDALQGYTLSKTKFFSDELYLVNNCGEIVNQWEFESEVDVKLLENGNLLYVDNKDSISQLIEITWEGQEVYNWSFPQSDFYFYYDQIKLPNGNVLSVAKEFWDKNMLHAIGMDTLQYPEINLQDKVMEININTGEIVWEWSAFDHVIQQGDISAANYGIISDHPELLNLDAIPLDGTVGQSFMINGIDYHEEFDQILISLRLTGEFVIIDHTTTTEEARGHSGGQYEKGGDILYRWGNPENYNRGSSADRFLYYQHNPNWIRHGAHKGKIICFNNGLNQPGEDFSTVPIVDPQPDINGNYTILEGQAFQPESPDEIVNKNNELGMFSGFVSSATVLENEHYYITSGNEGRIIELDESYTLVWDYIIPGGAPYRSYKYASDNSAFNGRDLTPSGKLPGDNSNIECEIFTSVNDQNARFDLHVFIDEASSIHISVPEETDYSVSLLDLSGKVLVQEHGTNQSHQIQGTNLAAGVYFVRVELKSGDWGIAKVVLMQ